jgi:hypothetical protein
MKRSPPQRGQLFNLQVTIVTTSFATPIRQPFGNAILDAGAFAVCDFYRIYSAHKKKKPCDQGLIILGEIVIGVLR